MFFLKEDEHTINLHPSFFGPSARSFIESKLMADLEGTNKGDYFIVCILDAFDFSEGRIVPGSGQAEYTIHYRAVVWRPFRGETLDGVVTTVVPTGFFVKVGPLSAFVSTQMIPSDMKYNGNATPAEFTNNADQVIKPKTQVRIKIKGIRNELGDMFAIATIKEDYLGYIPDQNQ